MLWILLAAGFSRRFGSPKLLSPFRGKPLIEATLTAYRAAGIEPFVVIRDNDPTLASHLTAQPSDKLFCCPTDIAAEGMGASLSWALRTLSERMSTDAEDASPARQALAIALADMPLIHPETLSHLNVLGTTLSPRQVMRPSYQGKSGHPVLFGPGLTGLMKSLGGDEGGKSILRRPDIQVTHWPTEDAGVLFDIDTPADLKVSQEL